MPASKPPTRKKPAARKTKAKAEKKIEQASPEFLRNHCGRIRRAILRFAATVPGGADKEHMIKLFDLVLERFALDDRGESQFPASTVTPKLVKPEKTTAAKREVVAAIKVFYETVRGEKTEADLEVATERLENLANVGLANLRLGGTIEADGFVLEVPNV